jgi:hypothetical protein
MVAGAAMGIGSMTCVMLGLPLTSVLLTAIFMGSDASATVPLVIVSVVVAYVGRAHFSPRPRSTPEGPSGPAASSAEPVETPTGAA